MKENKIIYSVILNISTWLNTIFPCADPEMAPISAYCSGLRDCSAGILYCVNSVVQLCLTLLLCFINHALSIAALHYINKFEIYYFYNSLVNLLQLTFVMYNIFICFSNSQSSLKKYRFHRTRAMLCNKLAVIKQHLDLAHVLDLT